jgi:hypothetical protein
MSSDIELEYEYRYRTETMSGASSTNSTVQSTSGSANFTCALATTKDINVGQRADITPPFIVYGISILETAWSRTHMTLPLTGTTFLPWVAIYQICQSSTFCRKS